MNTIEKNSVQIRVRLMPRLEVMLNLKVMVKFVNTHMHTTMSLSSFCAHGFSIVLPTVIDGSEEAFKHEISESSYKLASKSGAYRELGE